MYNPQGATKDEEGFDLVHLCSIFASDPYVMAFAKLIESGTSQVILKHRCSASPVWPSCSAGILYSSGSDAEQGHRLIFSLEHAGQAQSDVGSSESEYLSFCRTVLRECISEVS